MTEPEAKPETSPVQPTPVPPAPHPVPAPPTTVVVRDDDDKPSRSTREILLIISAIGAVISNVVVLGGGVYFKARFETAEKEATRVAAASDKKLDTIHDQTNSNLTSVKSELERATGEIELLKKLLVEEKLEDKKPEEKSKPETDP